MFYKNMIAFMASIVAIASCGIAYADESKNEITFVNTTGRPIWVEYWGDSKCITGAPDTGSYLVSINTRKSFELNPDSSCGDSSIKFNLSMKTANNDHPEVGGTVTYRKYKGTANKWLQKIEFVPTAGVNFFNFMRATCGASHQFCKGKGIPFTNAQAAIAVLNPGLSVDHEIGGYRNNR